MPELKELFESIPDRQSTFSSKWSDPDILFPFGIADMDFPTAPAIRQAIENRAAHGIFGYTDLPDEYFKSYQDWYQKRYGLELKKEGMVFTGGAVAAISSMVRRLTQPAQNVLVLTPVYNIFFNSILNQGRIPVESEMIYQNDHFEVDWDDLETKMADPQTTLMILCNPHNPLGKIYSKEELERILDLTEEYGVQIISDEVHGDLSLDKAYLPLASLKKGKKQISIYSPGKTFNLAGLHSAMVYSENPFLYSTISRGFNNEEIAEPNAFVVDATIAAFNHGEEWLEELKKILISNRKLIAETIDSIDGVTLIPSEATYLAWIDVSKVGEASAIQKFLKERYKLYLSEGSTFGKGGENYQRLNFATSPKLLEAGLKAFKEGIEQFRSENENK